MEPTSPRTGGGRGALAGALTALIVVGVGVLGLALFELATGGTFYAERGGGSTTLVAQFVLLMTPMAMIAAAVFVPIGVIVGWFVGRR